MNNYETAVINQSIAGTKKTKQKNKANQSY